MTARIFADTNLFVYAESQDRSKSEQAVAIIQRSPVISTQVVNETVSVLTRKYGFTLPEAHDIASSLLDLCEIVAVDAFTIRKAIDLATRYSLSHWDSLIVAAALLANCDILYSEDMQDGQIFDDRLTVMNPF
ncbi:PIN domain-containing protein [Methylomonas sp. SURF-2]|uniref:PIN domain-containing protein n=1 Tax=Methylomonas subterranea TaxID=2952225 RepID=A0ABT1TL30_9GAMM|nr:PIN domain-containing protein [Methylomonas sp. SURF-2]MCQ8106177.1 PIN domain-containing protein [Methylomonas sp. SURF-2]